MKTSLVSTKTLKLVDSFIKKPNSSLIIYGDPDGGGIELSSYIIDSLLRGISKNNYIIIEPENSKSIAIAQIRDLKTSFTTKINNESEIGRIALIKKADSMTIEAQNALLKLIEEPIANSIIILVTNKSENLLDTITSRCQIIKDLPISKAQALDYSRDRDYPDKHCDKAMLLSKGDPGIYKKLLSSNTDEVLPGLSKAKIFLSNNIFERLAKQKEYSATEDLENLIENSILIAETGMHRSKGKALERWREVLITLNRCTELLESNVSNKLVYIRLCIQL